MKLSAARVKQLKQLLKDELGLEYPDEELERVSLAIMRFVLHKELRKQSTIKREAKLDERKN